MHDETDRYIAAELTEFAQQRIYDTTVQPSPRLTAMATNYLQYMFAVPSDEIPEVLRLLWAVIAVEFDRSPPDRDPPRHYFVRKMRDAHNRYQRRKQTMGRRPGRLPFRERLGLRRIQGRDADG